MARVTVEDCILKVPNRFELVMLASQRAREIGAGAGMLVDRDNDKNPVVSLREIADTEMSLDNLRESLIKNHQKVLELEDDGEEVMDMMEGENEEWTQVEKQSAEIEIAAEGMHEVVGDDSLDTTTEEALTEEKEEGADDAFAEPAFDAGMDDEAL